MPQSWRIEVTGLRQVLDALNEMDKKAYRLLTREITDKAKEVQWAAATSVPGNPVSNWGSWFPTRRTFRNDAARNLAFSPSAVASGFKVKKSNFKAKGVARGIAWDVQQMDHGGSVFEVMGDASRIGEDSKWAASGNKQSLHLVAMVNARFGGVPKKGTRLLTKAYYKAIPNSQEFTERIRDSIIASAREKGLS
jgi:hypothetical protein